MGYSERTIITSVQTKRFLEKMFELEGTKKAAMLMVQNRLLGIKKVAEISLASSIIEVKLIMMNEEKIDVEILKDGNSNAAALIKHQDYEFSFEIELDGVTEEDKWVMVHRIEGDKAEEFHVDSTVYFRWLKMIEKADQFIYGLFNYLIDEYNKGS